MTLDAGRDVAVCGLGPMGTPIAERLLDSPYRSTVWNRTPARSDRFTGAARIARTPADAAEPIVLTVLPDLNQVEQITRGPTGLLAGWAARRIDRPILVLHGTTSPLATPPFAERLRAQHGVRVIDAPLSGGTDGAAAGTLSIMVGGDLDTAHHLEPLFHLYGRVVRYLGPSGSGALAKACNQIVVASTVAAISESLALAARAGLDRASIVEILEGGLASSEVLRQKKSKWLNDDYTEGGSAVNQLKDLRFVADAARSADIELTVAHAVKELFLQMVDAGDGALDHTGVIRIIDRPREP